LQECIVDEQMLVEDVRLNQMVETGAGHVHAQYNKKYFDKACEIMAQRKNIRNWKPLRDGQGKILDNDFIKLCEQIERDTIGGATSEQKGKWGNKVGK
jgi:hypothetical protein